MERVLLTASSNTGIGLWTSICVAFSSIFGCVSNNYKKKQQKVLDLANEELMDKFEKLGSDYILAEYRVTWSGSLKVTVSAIAVERFFSQPEDSLNLASPEAIDERMVEILRKELNNVFNDVSIDVVVNNIRKHKNNELDNIADKLERFDSKIERINYLKIVINRFKRK